MYQIPTLQSTGTGRCYVALLPAILQLGLACATAPPPFSQEVDKGTANTASEANSPALPFNPVEIAAQAEEAWGERADRRSLQRAILLWEQLRAETDQPDPAFLARLSRAYLLLADNHMQVGPENAEVHSILEKGIEAGTAGMIAASAEFAEAISAGASLEAVLQLIDKEGQPAACWYALNLGRYVDIKGFRIALLYKDRINAVMRRVLEIDPTFHFGAADRYFGVYFAEAPSYVGGDLKKSLQHFETALSVAPDFFANKVLFAEYYATRSEREELFTQLLREVVNGDPTAIPEAEPEQRLQQARAQKLLTETDSHFSSHPPPAPLLLLAERTVAAWMIAGGDSNYVLQRLR